jgi:hypothetical protein
MDHDQVQILRVVIVIAGIVAILSPVLQAIAPVIEKIIVGAFPQP